MVQTVSFGQSFDPASSFVDDVYIEVVPPAAYLRGVPTSVAAENGTASWGPVDTPLLVSTPQELNAFFGGVTAAALTDVHDLCFDASLALNQAGAKAGFSVWLSRVTDGTDVAASLGLLDSTSPEESVTFTGTTTTGDVVNLKFANPNFLGGSYTFSYTVGGGDTTTSLLAASINAAINANPTLIGAGISSTVLANALSLSWPYTFGAITFSRSVNGTTTATVGGTVTTNDILYLTVLDPNLVGGQVTVSYTVLGGDTLTSIATGLKNAINASTPLAAIGVTATSVGAVVSLKSVSSAQTTYTRDVTGDTETITFGAGPTELVAFGNLALTGMTLTARNTGTKGSEIQINIQSGSMANTATLVVVPFAGGGPREIFANLPTTGSQFWAAAQSAINNGQSAARPASRYIKASGASLSALAPLFGTFSLAGGTDGRSVTSAEILGSPTGGPSGEPTGIYVFEGLDIPPSVMWSAGLTDDAVYPAMQAFADQNNIFLLLGFASGLSVADVVDLKLAIGIADYQVGYVYGWVYVFDATNNQTRLVPPIAIAGGTIACLAPEQSPFNKTVSLVIGTERQNQISNQRAKFSNSEIAQLSKAGIMFFSNPIPGASAFGFRNGYNSVGNKQVTAVVEYSRLTNFIVQSNGTLLGQFEGKLQGQSANDPLRAQISAALNDFFGNLKAAGRIDDFLVICNNTNNSPSSIAAHAVIISENIRYLSSVLDIFAQIQGGTTVQTVANQVASTIPGT